MFVVMTSNQNFACVAVLLINTVMKAEVILAGVVRLMLPSLVKLERSALESFITNCFLDKKRNTDGFNERKIIILICEDSLKQKVFNYYCNRP